MFIRLTVALCAASLLAAAPVHASTTDRGELELGPTLGFTLPFGDLGEAADPGPAIGVQILHYLDARYALGGAVVFNALAGEGDLEVSVTEIHACGKVLLTEGRVVTSYAKGVLGLFSNRVAPEGDANADDDSTDFGLGAGAGLQSRQGETWGWFGEGLLMFDFAGDTWTYLAIRGGVNFYFGGR